MIKEGVREDRVVRCLVFDVCLFFFKGILSFCLDSFGVVFFIVV